MPERLLVPAIEQRIAAMIEVSRRLKQEAEAGKRGKKPTITISREFGCEAFPMTERLKELLEEKTGEAWMLMDKALLEEAAKDADLSESILQSIGTKPHLLDEMFSAFSPNWKSEKDYYRLLCRFILSLAAHGNAIIVGRGASIITQQMENCHHFRLYASQEFKVRSVARRAHLSLQDAELLVEKKQKERDRFIRDFLARDAHDLSFYHLVFNNDKSSYEKIAQTIAGYVFP